MLRLRVTQPAPRAPNRSSNSLFGSICGGNGRSYRRDTRKRLVITCDIRPSLDGKRSGWRHFPGLHHRGYHFLKAKAAATEILEHPASERTVGGDVRPCGYI